MISKEKKIKSEKEQSKEKCLQNGIRIDVRKNHTQEMQVQCPKMFHR